MVYSVKCTEVSFESGKLLSREMLDQLKKQTGLFLNMYNSYPDGIIYGFEFSECDGELFISEGALKKNGKFYFSDSRMSVTDVLDTYDCNRKNNEYIPYMALVLREAGDITEAECVVSSCMNLMILPDSETDSHSDVILAKFQYNFGSRAWKNNTDAESALKNQLIGEKSYDYSFLDTPYSLSGEVTFSPFIFSLMAELLEKKQCFTDIDFTLLSMIYQQKILSLNVLCSYLRRYGITCSPNNKHEIIEGFLYSLKTKKEEKKIVPVETVHETKKTTYTGIGL